MQSKAKWNYIPCNPPKKVRGRAKGSIQETILWRQLQKIESSLPNVWVKFTNKVRTVSWIYYYKTKGFEFTTRKLPSGKRWLYCRYTG